MYSYIHLEMEQPYEAELLPHKSSEITNYIGTVVIYSLASPAAGKRGYFYFHRILSTR